MRESVFQIQAKACFRFAAFVILLSAFAVRAENLPFKSYTTSEGLAHDRVNRIVKDSRGFLWFCTAEGLSRFDGYEFKNYTQDDGLPHRSISDFLETRNGDFWIATGDGLVLFNPLGNPKSQIPNPKSHDAPMFRVFRPADLKPEQKTWSVADLLETRDGVVWAASTGGIYQLEKQADWSLRRFEIAAAQSKNPYYARLLEDRSGAIWVGTGYGLYRILPDKSVQTINLNIRVESLLEDREGRVWVGGGGGAAGDATGLQLFSIQETVPRLIRVLRKQDGLGADGWMNALLETSDGRIYIGSGYGFHEYAAQTDSSQPPIRILTHESVAALGEDASGNIWLSTNSSGVRRLARGGFVNFDKSDNLTLSKMSSIVSSSDGEIYIISGDKQLHRFNGVNFDAVTPRQMPARSWGSGQLSFKDHLGAWWIAGMDGLYRYPRTDNFADLANAKPEKIYTMRDGLFTNEIFQLFEDSRGDIWISTIGEVGDTLQRWERATDRIHRYTTNDNLPSKNGVVAYGEDRAGNVWLGFYFGGLYRYRSGKFESFTAEDGLPPGYINNIFTDSKGRVWVATSSGGVVRIDNPTSVEKPRLEILTTRHGLSSNQATCTTEDNFGRIYVATGRGVDRLDLPTGRIKVFTQADGLPENIVSLCSRDAAGALWFGTSQGLARYIPAADERSEPPPIYLSNLRVNGEPIRKLSELGEVAVANLDLASDQRQIQIDFFAPGFGTGESLRYQYKLEGAGAEDWSEPTELRTVNLNLSAGAYQFLVRAVNSNGEASPAPASVAFKIARPIWQRWWFLLSIVFLISLAIYTLYRSRVAQLLRLERVRTRIATDLHDDIGASLSKIAILSEIVNHQIAPIVANNNEVGKSLTEISGTSRELVDSMSDIVWAINPQRDSLSDLTGRMRNLASEMCELADIGLRFSLSGVEAESNLPLGADLRRDIYLIFKETINNLVKHSGSERVEIEFQIAGDEFIFIVKDDGDGFDVASKNNGNGNGATRGGNGLINMRRRAENLDGAYEIKSAAGQGTTVRLRVPLKHRFQGFRLKKFLSK